MKCIPITLSGRRVPAASFVIEIDEVFEALLHGGLPEPTHPRYYNIAWMTLLCEVFPTLRPFPSVF